MSDMILELAFVSKLAFFFPFLSEVICCTWEIQYDIPNSLTVYIG
jgi:hypothetical protein